MLNELKEIVQQFLEKLKANYKFREDCDSFEVKYISDNNTFKKTEIIISMDDDCIVFYAFLFFDKELSDKGEFFKMLNKINLNTENGHFIYNAEINGIECRSHIACYGIIPTFEMIEDSFNAVKRLMNKFTSVIKNAAEGKFLTQTALEELLKGESSDGVVYPIETA